MRWKKGNFAPTVVNHGRGLHDSPQGLGATHSILQRRTHRKFFVEQSRYVSRQKTCLVSQPPIAPGPGQCSNQTIDQELTKLTKRIRQFPGGVGVGAPGASPGEEEEEAGDLVTGPVEQWLKRMIKGSPSTPKPPITPVTPKGKTTSKIPVKKGSPSTSRGDDISRRLEAIRERHKTLEKR